MEKYGFNELKEYIVEDFEEFTKELNYTAEQAAYRILDDYIKAIQNWEFQKAIIYFTLTEMISQYDKIPIFIHDEVSGLTKQEKIKEYLKDVEEEEVSLFLKEIERVKNLISGF